MKMFISFKAIYMCSEFSVMTLGQEHPFLFQFCFLRALHGRPVAFSLFFQKLKEEKVHYTPQALEASFFLAIYCFNTRLYDMYDL